MYNTHTHNWNIPSFSNVQLLQMILKVKVIADAVLKKGSNERLKGSLWHGE